MTQSKHPRFERGSTWSARRSGFRSGGKDNRTDVRDTRRRRNQTRLDLRAQQTWKHDMGGYLAVHWSIPALVEEHFEEVIETLNEKYYRETGLIGPFEYVTS